MNNPVNTILCGDALSVLRTLPDNYVQCVVTSPPYFRLRSYLPDGHPDKAKEIGLEETPQEFIARLVEVFREVYRVLRSDGVLWVNIGDTYANDQKWGGKTSGKHVDAVKGTFPRSKRYTGLPGKNMIGIPWRLAFGLQDDGWILRSDIIWNKPTAMPESITDRPTKSHEYVFLLTKQPNYYYDAQAIAEPIASSTISRNAYADSTVEHGRKLPPEAVMRTEHTGNMQPGKRIMNHTGGRNKRTVWSIAAQPYPLAHFATMPPKLVDPCVLAGTSPRACEKCGAPWKRQIERTPMIVRNGPKSGGYGSRTTDSLSGTMIAPAETCTVGWMPTCACKNTGSGKCVVLDPFSGAGTVAMVALQHSRNYLGVELNPEYIKLAQKRIETVQPNLWSHVGEATA